MLLMGSRSPAGHGERTNTPVSTEKYILRGINEFCLWHGTARLEGLEDPHGKLGGSFIQKMDVRSGHSFPSFPKKGWSSIYPQDLRYPFRRMLHTFERRTCNAHPGLVNNLFVYVGSATLVANDIFVLAGSEQHSYRPEFMNPGWHHSMIVEDHQEKSWNTIGHCLMLIVNRSYVIVFLVNV